MNENKELFDKHQKVHNASQDINILQAEVEAIDKIVGKTGTDKETIQQEIVSFTTIQDSRISIFDLQSVHQYNDENYVIYTHQLDVTGSLNQLLHLAYNFEKKFIVSRLVSQNFYTVKKNNNPDILHLKLIFQNYENTK